ncbi:MAG: hypothetical protein WBV94_09860 [Blastocatellia bacterium]
MQSIKERFLAAVGPLTIMSLAAMAQQPSDVKPKQLPEKSDRVKVNISCERIGTGSDLVRTMRLTNDTNGTISKGERIYWSTSDGEKGSMLIAEAFPKRQRLTVYDQIGHLQYTCEAWFFRLKFTTTK